MLADANCCTGLVPFLGLSFCLSLPSCFNLPSLSLYLPLSFVRSLFILFDGSGSHPYAEGRAQLCLSLRRL